MLLAKEEEAGNVLLAQDRHWLEENDEDEVASAHFCLMARNTESDDKSVIPANEEYEVYDSNFELINAFKKQILQFQKQLKSERLKFDDFSFDFTQKLNMCEQEKEDLNEKLKFFEESQKENEAITKILC